MNIGSSAFISVGGHSSDAISISSWYQRSCPSIQLTFAPVLLTTIEVLHIFAFDIASSVFDFRGIALPPLTPSSAVIIIVELQSSILPANASGEKPPNTTE